MFITLFSRRLTQRRSATGVSRADSRSAGDRACIETPNDDDGDDDREVSALKLSQFRETAINLCASRYHIRDIREIISVFVSLSFFTFLVFIFFSRFANEVPRLESREVRRESAILERGGARRVSCGDSSASSNRQL